MSTTTINWADATIYHFDHGEIDRSSPLFLGLMTELRETGALAGGYLSESAFERNDGEDDVSVEWSGFEPKAPAINHDIVANLAHEAAAILGSTVDGTADLYTIAECALRDDASATAEDVAAAYRDARADAAMEAQAG